MIVVVMGVSGSGKTTAGALVAARLGCPFQEGDALHPAANVEKMRRGEALSDADRLPWLERIARLIDAWLSSGQCGVVACSVLKRDYRALILGGRPDVRLVYLKGSYALIRRRMAARQGHFMPLDLLDSQFATLEEPGPDEHPIVVDVSGSPVEIAEQIVERLKEPAR